MKDKFRTAIVVSHPVQHFCPQYESFSEVEGISLKVFFASALGYKSYKDPQFGKEVKWNNIDLSKFHHSFLNGEEVLPVDGSIDAPSLDAALTAYQPDLLIIYGYFQKLQRRARRWALKNKVKIAYISDSELRHPRNKVKEMLKYLFIRRYFAPIAYFLSVGDANEQFYKYYGVPVSKFERMHFPIDVKQYQQAFANYEWLRQKLREQLGIGSTDLVLLVVGKLVPWKNQDHIIDAMALLEKDGVVIHLLVAGSGEKQEAWMEKAKQLEKSRVHFAGFVNVEELPSYYAATDIYVHPASIEPHSIAVSEAIYMGNPVIISDTCGSYGDNDDVQENRNGLVFPFGNIPALAEKINMLATDVQKRKAFGKYSREIAIRFQQRAHREILIDLKNKLLAAKD